MTIKKGTEKRWLLIFDNADESGLLLSSWPWEHRGCGSIIITSRNNNIHQGLPDNTRTIQVSGLTEEECETLLLSRLGEASTDKEDRHISRDIAKFFNCWPLALRQLSAFLEDSLTTIDKMWEILSCNPNVEGEIYSYRDTASPYEHTLMTAWEPILSNLPHNSTMLLSVLSVLDPDKIPNQLFTPPVNFRGRDVGFLTNEFE